ncbi:uncharacterized protein LOC129876949 [Solanum dulcamara]|uniref:uncharacterized protein LOC129876949 n=1 Tax=Solanum dulcamara TaxID=45834 RepID=UPI0024868DFC|nr:uncharacterized protein LOC129876949 [Solanum dulcamara]
MGFTAMGFFFILFPEDESTIITKNKQKTNLSSLKSIKHSNSTHLFPKAQFIISICVLLIFITFLLFTISTCEPSPRTQLSKSKFPPFQQHALQGMGTLYRKGTRSMSDLIVAHVIESVTLQELKLFTKLIYRSKISSKSDILFIFPIKSIPFENTIVEENTSFLKLIHGYKDNSSNIDPTHFLISSNKANRSEEPIWGRKKQSNFREEDDNKTESTRFSYGSVVGFYADELDPENSLSGFMDHVSMNLRRWACYPMLFGRIRRNFKHIMLVDVKEMLVLGDSPSRVKNLSHDSVLVFRRKNFQKNHKKQANPEIIIGGLRGIRRLSNAMLIEIVRESMQHKKKNSVTESTLFNQLVGNEFIMKNVELISGESIVELSSLTELDKKTVSLLISKFSIIRRGNSNVDIISVFKKYLCSFPLDSTVYSDC